MDQLLPPKEQSTQGCLLLGTVVSIDTSKGVRVRLDADDSAGAKFYKSHKGLPLVAGDRVVLAPISGSYVVLGIVGLPARKYNMNKCPTESYATAASCANWINTIIEALTELGLMSKNGW